MMKWQHKLRQSDIRYSDFLHFATYTFTGETERMCKGLDIENIVNQQIVASINDQFKKLNGELQDFLIRTLPPKFESKQCTLHEVLRHYSMSFPLVLQNQLSVYMKQMPSIPADKCDSDVTQRSSPHSTLSIPLPSLRKLLQDLKEFLNPFKNFLDRLVFFTLYPSHLFYEHFCIEKKHRVEESKHMQSINTESGFLDLTTPVILGDDPLQTKRIRFEELNVKNFVKNLEKTFAFLVRLLTGQATYLEITANGEISFDELDIDQEYKVLTMYSNCFKISCPGLEGVRSMVELSQYAVLIPMVENVCRHFNLTSCLNDPALKSLLTIVNTYESLEGRQSLTPTQALSMVNEIKEVLLIRPQLCYELFYTMSSSKPFYLFLQEGQFIGEAGKTSFHEHHQLITAQLQHEEYDEVVLNHLHGAFKIMTPFLENQQDLKNLMSQLSRFDSIANGLKQLETVNTNIMIIRLWFARAKVSSIILPSTLVLSIVLCINLDFSLQKPRRAINLIPSLIASLSPSLTACRCHR